MEKYERKLVIMLAITAVILSYFTAILYIAIGELTYASFISLLGIILAVLTIIAIVRGEDIEKVRIWFWKLFPVIVVVLLLVSIFFGLKL